MKYACIEQHRGEHALQLMCRALGVSRSGYYAWRKREPSRRAREDQHLLIHVRAAHRISNETYGTARGNTRGCTPSSSATVYAAAGSESSASCVALMREGGLVAVRPKRFRTTTDSDHGYPVAPNLLGRRFSLEEIGGPDRVWASDITYVPTREGWLYLAVVLDLVSRRVVGWSMRQTLEAEIATDALQMTLAGRNPEPGLIHHSDKRSASESTLAGQRIAVRLSCLPRAVGGAQNTREHEPEGRLLSVNAVAESFFATLEWELIERSDWHTRREAERDIFNYIEVWYNRERRHSTLGYLSPADYEAQLTQSGKAA